MWFGYLSAAPTLLKRARIRLYRAWQCEPASENRTFCHFRSGSGLSAKASLRDANGQTPHASLEKLSQNWEKYHLALKWVRAFSPDTYLV